MATKEKRHRRGGKKNRKHRRNYRWNGVDHSTTKYRQRHHIGADETRSGHRYGSEK